MEICKASECLSKLFLAFLLPYFHQKRTITHLSLARFHIRRTFPCSVKLDISFRSPLAPNSEQIRLYEVVRVCRGQLRYDYGTQEEVLGTMPSIGLHVLHPRNEGKKKSNLPSILVRLTAPLTALNMPLTLPTARCPRRLHHCRRLSRLLLRQNNSKYGRTAIPSTIPSKPVARAEHVTETAAIRTNSQRRA